MCVWCVVCVYVCVWCVVCVCVCVYMCVCGVLCVCVCMIRIFVVMCDPMPVGPHHININNKGFYISACFMK